MESHQHPGRDNIWPDTTSREIEVRIKQLVVVTMFAATALQPAGAATRKPRVDVPFLDCRSVPSGPAVKTTACTKVIPAVVSRAGKILEARIGITDYRIVYARRTWHVETSPVQGPCASKVSLSFLDDRGGPVFMLDGCGTVDTWILCPGSLDVGEEYCTPDSSVPGD